MATRRTNTDDQKQVIVVQQPGATQSKKPAKAPELFRPWYAKKKQTTQWLLIVSFIVCILTVGYDVITPDIFQDGIIIQTVSDSIYTFLNFLFGTCAGLYVGRKITDSIAMTRIDQSHINAAVTRENEAPPTETNDGARIV